MQRETRSKNGSIKPKDNNHILKHYVLRFLRLGVLWYKRPIYKAIGLLVILLHYKTMSWSFKRERKCWGHKDFIANFRLKRRTKLSPAVRLKRRTKLSSAVRLKSSWTRNPSFSRPCTRQSTRRITRWTTHVRPGSSQKRNNAPLIT